MIYEGTLIRRLVTPSRPGDPALAAAGAPEFRIEFVLRDQPGEPVTWTVNREEGQHYPTHLAASRRAAELGPHCHASVVGGNRGDQDEIPTRRGASDAASGGVPGPTRLESHHGVKIETQAATTLTRPRNLPSAETGSHTCPPTSPQTDGLRGVDPDVCPTRAAGGNAISKKRNRKPSRSRLAALRLAAERVENREAWYNKGQYA